MKVVDDCKRILDDSRDKNLAWGDFTKWIGKNGSGPLLHGALLWKKDVEEVLQRELTSKSLPDASFRFQDAPEATGHLVDTPGSKHMQEMREKSYRY